MNSTNSTAHYKLQPKDWLLIVLFAFFVALLVGTLTTSMKDAIPHPFITGRIITIYAVLSPIISAPALYYVFSRDKYPHQTKAAYRKDAKS